MLNFGYQDKSWREYHAHLMVLEYAFLVNSVGEDIGEEGVTDNVQKEKEAVDLQKELIVWKGHELGEDEGHVEDHK